MKKKIGIDFKHLLNEELPHMAKSHLECWQDRYKDYKRKSDLAFDLWMNHDDSLEIERMEKDLKRELTDDESEMLSDKCQKEIVKTWHNKSTY